MSPTSTIRALEALGNKVRIAVTLATRANETELAKDLLDVQRKIKQKLDGHRAQRRQARKK